MRAIGEFLNPDPVSGNDSFQDPYHTAKAAHYLNTNKDKTWQQIQEDPAFKELAKKANWDINTSIEASTFNERTNTNIEEIRKQALAQCIAQSAHEIAVYRRVAQDKNTETQTKKPENTGDMFSWLNALSPFTDTEWKNNDFWTKDFIKFLFIGAIAFLTMLCYTQLRLVKDLVILSVGATSMLAVLKIASVFTAIYGASLWDKAKRAWGENALYAGLIAFNAFFLLYAFFPQLGLASLFAFLPASVLGPLHLVFASMFYLSSELWAVIMIDGVFQKLKTQIYNKESVGKKTGFLSLFQSGANIVAALSMTWAFGNFTALTTHITLVASSVLILSALLAVVYGVARSLGHLDEAEKRTNNPDPFVNLAAIADCFESEQEIDAMLTANIPVDLGVSDDEKETNKQQMEMTLHSADPFYSKLYDVFSFRYKSLAYLFYGLVCYNLCTVIFELVWKNQIKIFVDAVGIITYGQWMSHFTLYLAIASAVFAVFGPLISNIPSKIRNWITPVMFVGLSILFFGLIFTPAVFAPVVGVFQPVFSLLFGSSLSGLLFQIAAIGTIENILVKSSNYSIFKPGIDEVWATMSKVNKDNWQDVVAQLAGKFGKAFGGLIITVLGILIGGGINGALPIMPILLAGVAIFWFGMVRGMNSLLEVKAPQPPTSFGTNGAGKAEILGKGSEALPDVSEVPAMTGSSS